MSEYKPIVECKICPLCIHCKVQKKYLGNKADLFFVGRVPLDECPLFYLISSDSFLGNKDKR